MSRIKVMSRELASRIAAGEVVERPGSVVKELVENSIDAGATKISVSVEKAGSRLISIIDNGCGMDEEDALLAFEEHGTSKLSDDKDLFSIGTLGFRGEAVPSIASVSRFTLCTRRKEDENGVRVSVDAGVIGEVVPDGCAAGTSIEVRDLFYNVPARKKFLKSPATEEHLIEDVMINLALANYELAFSLRFDRRSSFNSAGSQTPDMRIVELFGRSFFNNLLPIEHRENGIVIKGFAAAPGLTRPSRREQRIFVNRRAIESQAIYRGIRDGYGTLNAVSGRYPPVFLYIDIAHDEVDVNVHPAKREVRFKSEYSVSSCVANAISQALRRKAEQLDNSQDDNNVVKQIASGFSVDTILEAAMVQYSVSNTVEQDLTLPGYEEKTFENENRTSFQKPVVEKGIEIFPVSAEEKPVMPPVEESLPEEAEKSSFSVELAEIKFEEKPPFAPIAAISDEPVFHGNWPTSVLGFWENTYILCDSPGGLLLVDQHAAHERVLFERIINRARQGVNASQMLLIPKAIELRSNELSLLMRNRKIFEDIGFEFESAGGTTVLLSALPADLAEVTPQPEDLIPDMLEELLIRQNTPSLSVDFEAAAKAACHNAIRANDVLTVSEAQRLLDELRSCRQGTMCPHGRPTMVTFSKKEVEKRFQRR